MRACVALVVGMIAATADARSGDVVAAFVSSADLGLWVIGVAVLGLGALVVLESLLSRRTRADADM